MAETKKDPGATLADVLAGIQAGQKAILDRIEAVEKAKPAVTQTDEAALAMEAERKRAETIEARHKGELDKAAAREAELVAKLEAAQREFDARRLESDVRRSNYTLPELTEGLRQVAGVTRADARHFWGRLGAVKAASSDEWAKQFPSAPSDNGSGRTPMDVLMRGGLEPYTAEFRLDTGGTMYIPSLRAMTAGGQDEVLAEAQKWNDVVYLWRLAKQDKGEPVTSVQGECPYWPQFARAMAQLGKALDTTDTANWIPTGFSSRVYERYDASRNLVKYIPMESMPQNPWDMPVIGAAVTVSRVGENTADPESATVVPTSDVSPLKCSLSLVEFAVRTSLSWAVAEDSAVSLAQRVPDEIGRAWAKWQEEAVINGDLSGRVAGFHRDTNITSATDPRTAHDGLRELAFQNNYTSSLATFSAENVFGMLGSLGVYGSNAADVVWATGFKVRVKLFTLATSGNATVFVGNAILAPQPAAVTMSVIPTMFGSPLVVTQALYENVGASGWYDGTITADGQLLVFNAKAFVLGQRNAAMKFATGNAARTAQDELVAWVRQDFKPVYAVASNHSVHVGKAITF